MAESEDPETGTTVKSPPVPVRATVCGLPVALSEMVSEPERAPAAVGVKVTVSVQEAFAATLVPQLLVCEKSPEAVALLIVRAEVPVFFSVTVCDALAVVTN